MVATLLYSLALLQATISVPEKEISDHLRYLASPELEGRLTGSKGQDMAVAYIEKAFKSYGLKPGATGSFVHTFATTVNLRAAAKNKLSFTKGGKTWTPKLESEYLPLAGSVNDKAVSGDLVYVGYGLEEEGWNDFAGVDVKGKVAVMLRGAPTGKTASSNNRKARLAAEKGAVGVVFVGPSGPGSAEFPKTNRGQGIPGTLEIVAVGIHSKFFKDLTGMDFVAARAATAPQSKVLDVKFEATTELETNNVTGRNVIGYLEGKDPVLKNEYIIVGAHFDHLGYGEVGSRTNSDAYHGGADDNGSGTAGLIAMAKQFAKWHGNQRTIIFQAYSGEEIGLQGSRAWANDHPELLAKTTAMLNMDMIGTVRGNNVYVFGLSSAKGWEGILKQVSVPNLNLVTAPHVRGDSDQASFARKDVPVLFWHTGLTNEYHSEKDLFHMVNLNGATRVANAVSQTVLLLDKAPKLEFDKANVVLGNKSTDRVVPPNDPPPGQGGGDGMGRRIRVGFIPDYAAGGPGAAISGVGPGSPAAKAGLKAGDRITEFNGKAVSDVETLNEAMKTCKPGDKVKVVYQRDGKSVTVEITVEERTDG